MRPGVVWFGEALPEAEWKEAERRMRTALGTLREVGAPEVPREHGVRVVVPRVDGRHVLRVYVLPQAGLRVAVGGDAAVGAHACAGEDLDVGGVGDKGAGGVNGGGCGHGGDGTCVRQESEVLANSLRPSAVEQVLAQIWLSELDETPASGGDQVAFDQAGANVGE